MKTTLLTSTLILLLSASTCFAIGYSKCIVGQRSPGTDSNSLKTWEDEWTIAQTSSVKIDIWLSDVPEPLITACVLIESDPLQVSIDNPTIDGAWDKGMSNTIKDPMGQPPGTLMITAGNLSSVRPDENGDIRIATIEVQCLTGSCDGSVMTFKTIPRYDSVVGNSAGVYDPEISPNYFYFDSPPCTTSSTTTTTISTTTTTISSCDGSEDICVRIGNGVGIPGSQENPVTVTMENITDKAVRAIQLEVCDAGDFLDCTTCALETEYGCSEIRSLTDWSVPGIEEGLIYTLFYDVTPDILPGRCIPLTIHAASATDDSRPMQLLKVGVEPGEFCITAFELPAIDIKPKQVLRSPWIPLPYLMVITGQEISKESFEDIVFMPFERIVALPPLVWNKHYIWNFIWVLPRFGDEQGTVFVNLKDENLVADFEIIGREPIEWELPQLPGSFSSFYPDSGEQGMVITDVTITGKNTTFQDDGVNNITFSPPDGLVINYFVVKTNTEIEFEVEISEDAPVGFKTITVIYDNSSKFIVGTNEFEVIEGANPSTTTTTTDIFTPSCGDVWPPPSSPEAIDCGDGVVDENDVNELINLIIGVAEGTRELTNCQLIKGNIPNGLPPFCGNPAVSRNCESDGDLDINDVMEIINKARGGNNCCDYCESGIVF